MTIITTSYIIQIIYFSYSSFDSFYANSSFICNSLSCNPTIASHFFFDKLCEGYLIVSDIVSDTLSDIVSDTLSDIVSDIPSTNLLCRYLL